VSEETFSDRLGKFMGKLYTKIEFEKESFGETSSERVCYENKSKLRAEEAILGALVDEFPEVRMIIDG